eukprot:scaffold41812_cov32-Tisochrysis_lutea.AAC.5
MSGGIVLLVVTQAEGSRFLFRTRRWIRAGSPIGQWHVPKAAGFPFDSRPEVALRVGLPVGERSATASSSAASASSASAHNVRPSSPSVSSTSASYAASSASAHWVDEACETLLLRLDKLRKLPLFAPGADREQVLEPPQLSSAPSTSSAPRAPISACSSTSPAPPLASEASSVASEGDVPLIATFEGSATSESMVVLLAPPELEKNLRKRLRDLDVPA